MDPPANENGCSQSRESGKAACPASADSVGFGQKSTLFHEIFAFSSMLNYSSSKVLHYVQFFAIGFHAPIGSDVALAFQQSGVKLRQIQTAENSV